jgi:FtsZ-binding cell division protein ZapB
LFITILEEKKNLSVKTCAIYLTSSIKEIKEDKRYFCKGSIRQTAYVYKILQFKKAALQNEAQEFRERLQNRLEGKRET